MKALYLDNDWEFVWPGVRRNTDSGQTEPAIQLANLTAHISETPNGPPIHADLSKPMTERASTPGEYFAIVDGDKLRLHLESNYIGAKVWEVFGDGINVKYNSPRKVFAVRKP